MIKVTENIQLKKVLNSDAETLFKLMKEIYPPAYSHFWIDKGDWYINTHYAKENILRELLEENSDNYFIIFKDSIIGNFRIIWDEKLTGLTHEKQVKLHMFCVFHPIDVLFCKKSYAHASKLTYEILDIKKNFRPFTQYVSSATDCDVFIELPNGGTGSLCVGEVITLS